MIIAGIDYSLNGPAICVFNSKDKFRFENCSFYYLTDKKSLAKTFLSRIHGKMLSPYNHDCERYDTISEWAVEMCYGCEQVAIEGYAYAAKGRVFNIAENTGLLKYKFYQQSMPVEVVNPSIVKKMATGKGNADKNLMHQAFVKETKHNLFNLITPNRKNIGNPVSDIVDSYYICKSLYYEIVSVI